MLPKLAKRVLRLITRVSRSESIGGLVTWLKFWRKKWLSAPRARRDDGERRVVAHAADRLLGVLDHRAEQQLHVLRRQPGGDLAAAQLGAVEAARRLGRVVAGQVGEGAEMLDPLGIGRGVGDAVLDRASV